jgi:hypothetical protein
VIWFCWRNGFHWQGILLALWRPGLNPRPVHVDFWWTGVALEQAFPKVQGNSLREFQPLRYSRRGGHAEGEYVNIGRETQVSVPPYRCSICPPLVTRQMSIL